jgi:hypothetical protein
MSATPVYLAHLKACGAAYAKCGTPEALRRWLVLLTVQRVAGRSSEVANLDQRALRVDNVNQCVFGVMDQSKLSKTKPVVFVAGADRHCDWFLAFADHMVTNPSSPIAPQVPSGSNPHSAFMNTHQPMFPWLLPPLLNKAAGPTIGTYITQLIPETNSKEYKDYVVQSIPKEASAGTFNMLYFYSLSIRRGVRSARAPHL